MEDWHIELFLAACASHLVVGLCAWVALVFTLQPLLGGHARQAFSRARDYAVATAWVVARVLTTARKR